MERKLTKILLLAFTFCCLAAVSAFAQTVTLGSIDPGPYGQGSTIAVPFHLNTTPGCASSTNIFNLYLSDANGNFGAPLSLGQYGGFYGTFINGVLPNNLTPSANYRIRIQCSDPAIAAVTSGPFIVNALPGITAGTSSQAINSSTPEVFGACIGADNTSYSFVNTSSAGAVATATFFNELTQTTESTITFPAFPFNAKAANYTIVVRAISAGVVGTKAYSLINNPVNNSFGASGSNQVCLDGATKLTYSVDINSPNGIQKNYPGLTYSVTWGDGLSTNYTLCEIVANGGTIEHTYKKASCGNVANGLQNVFQIDLQPTSPFCGKLGTPVTGYARVIEAPKNKIGYPETACTNTVVAFANQSIPGQDPNSTTFDCTNINALYTWVVDGQTAGVNYPLDKPLEYTFTTNGVHSVGLHLQNGNAICEVEDKIINICIQNPPKPSFTLVNATICTSGPVTPTNTSVVDETCDANTSYQWVVTGPAQPTYSGGTTAASKTPTFNFTVSGLYTVTLDVTTNSCGLVASEPQEVVINLNPTARLSANSLICGKDQTLTFGPSATVTKTTLTGTAKALPTTYVWDITGGAFSYENGTTANSQYPQVKFTEYKAYTIKVTHTNNCNVATATQVLTFQQSPDVNAGGDRTICEGSSTFMDAEVTGVYNSLRWVGGTGTFTPGRNVKKPTYTPSAAEIAAGTATISLEVTTNLAAPCNIITNPAVITITRKDDITSGLTADICTGSNFSYTITSQNPASTYNWTAVIFSGTATGFGATGSGSTINDVINDSGNGDAVIKYTITPTTNGCPGNSVDLFVIVNRIPVVTATPPAAPICTNSAAGITLTPSIANTTYTWTSVADAGISGNTQQSTPVAAVNIADVLTNAGTLYGNVKYIITPYHGACAGQPSPPVTVVIAPAPIAAVAGPDEHICAGPTYTLKGNNPSPGTGMWTLASGQTGITFSDATKPDAVVNGLKPGNIYQFVWSINTAAGCTPTTSTVTITVDVPTVGGAVDGSVPVCADANHGFLNLTGNLGNVLSWESSTDGTNWITQLNATNQYEYTSLIQTTQFRAVVQNGVCNIERSAIATVTVNQPAIAANGGPPLTTLCNAPTHTLSGNDPTPFAGFWTQTAGPPSTFVDATNPKTVVNGLIGGYTYKFMWTIKGTAPCADSQHEITIVNNPDVTPKFIIDYTNTVCGPLTVNFTNQSSPNFAGTTYLWDFGDGSGNTNDINPQHIFQPSPDGTDITYKVTLTIINNCVPHEPFPMNITVKPAAPVASILPEKLSACGSLAISLKNTSPGTNQYYDFFVFDGKTQVGTMHKTDKSDAVFAPLGPSKNADSYTVYMVATDFCGNITQSSPSIPINIYPATFVPLFFAKDNKTADCFPLTVAFENISSGGQTFLYRVYDAAVGGNKVDEIQGSRTEQPYTFTAPGTYYVSIVAKNDCTPLGFESTNRIKFEAYPTPAPNFTADATSGCKALRVSFANTTPSNGATPSQSLTYEWDFGDGSAHFFGYTPIPHVYSPKNSPYTITLKVTNLATGCTDVIVKPEFIKVTAAPNVDFAANPGFITKIPNYHFAFDDKTSGTPNPVSWDWDFGDGSTSAQQNPGHTYSDTGNYKVTLRVINRDGCDSTVSHNVQITGIPGQLYIPNAFMPAGSTSELRTFLMKGSGIESWRMQIFNNWGQLIWETTKLNSTGEPVESWDGTYKGVPVQQGVYVWQATAKFINGTEWKGMEYGPRTLPKRSGVIHLIR